MGEVNGGVAGLEDALRSAHIPRRPAATPWWLWSNVFSLDAVSVAICWHLLFARVYHARPGIAVTFVLGSAVWVIYLLDHWLDARNMLGSTGPARKRFFRKHRDGMLRLIMGAAVATVLLAWCFLKRDVFAAGIFLGILVLIYFAAVHVVASRVRLRWPRQVAVAGVFSAAVAMPTWLEVHGPQRLLVAVLPFFVLCLLNCSAVEVWEWQTSIRHPGDVPDVWARWLAARLAPIAGVFTVAILGLGRVAGMERALAGPLVVSGSAVLMLALWKRQSKPETAMVCCACLDLALLSPLLVLVAK